MLVGQPLGGIIADLWGRRGTLIITLALSGLLLPFLAVSNSFVFFAVWVGMYALLTSPAGALLDSLVLDFIDRHPRLSFAQLRLWGAIGWGVMAYVVGWFLTGRDLRLSFFIAATLLLLGGVLAWRVPRERQAGDHQVAKRTWSGAGELLKNKPLLLFLLIVALTQTGAAAIFSFFPVYMNDLGASRQMIGLAIGLQGIGELPLYLAAGAITRRIGAHRTIALAISVFAARCFLYSVISTPMIAMFVELLHGLSFSLFLVASVEYVDKLVPVAWRATGQSLFSTAYFGAGSILGNTWAGLLYDRFGVQTLFRINGFMIIVLAVIALIVLRPRE